MPLTEDILILGASARAAAFSAIRAGLRPRCLDYFADADLAAVCPAIAIDPRESDLLAAARQFLSADPNESGRAGGVSPLFGGEDLVRKTGGSRPPLASLASSHCSWFYTGPFENRPEVIESLARECRLLGSGAEALRAVRNPWNVASVLTRHGLAAPKLARPADGPPSPGRWLVKPLASAGGMGVRFWDGAPIVDGASQYLQEFIDGPALSALCVAAGGRSRLLGIARQEQGSPFLYRGSVGPWPVAGSITAKLARLGDILAAEFALVGLFGVDFILADGEPRPIEINPRYTASVEVLELAARRSFLAEHLRACVEGELPDASPSFSSVVGKRVLHASGPIRFPEVPIPQFPRDVFQVPPIADIPRPGSVIPPGEPIMTVLAQGRNPADCLGGLDRLGRAWRERLEPNSGESGA